VNNALLANSIYLNGNQTGPGIALIDDGNGDQAAPIVYTASQISDTGNITLTGVLTTPPGSLTAPNGDYRIEVFRNLPADEMGFPANVTAFEGRTFILAENVTVSGGGVALSINLPAGSMDIGDWVTLTATSLSANQPQNTSAFSNAVQVTTPVVAVGTNGPSSPGVTNPPAARLYQVGSLNGTNIVDPANASNATLISQSVTDSPLLNVGNASVANATLNINLADVYGASFADAFTGGLRVAHADLDGDGYDELITAPGPSSDASFGNSLRTIGIFNGNPAGGGWTTQLINVGTTFGSSYTGGFLLAVGDVARLGATPDAPTVKQIIVAPSSTVDSAFNGAAVITIGANARAAQPAVSPTVLLTTPVASGTITGLTAGAYGGLGPIGSGGTDGEVSISLATNTGGITTVTQYRRTAASGTTLVQHSQFAVTLQLNEGDGATTNVFANGAGLTAGDLNGDRIDDLVVTAGAQGMSNFRAISGSAVMSGSQPAIDAALGTNLAQFSSIMAGGRFANFVPPPGPDPAQQTTNLDYFYDLEVDQFVGSGFNAPLYATAADTDGDGMIELFIALGTSNSTQNTIKHFAFSDDVNPADRWFVRQGFQALNLGTSSFDLGEGLRLG
jgi:hypothetical protein